MAEINSNDTGFTLNLSLDQYDLLIESIAKAHALVHVILSVSDLEQIPSPTLHDYFWMLNDLIDDIWKSCHNYRHLSPQNTSEII